MSLALPSHQAGSRKSRRLLAALILGTALGSVGTMLAVTGPAMTAHAAPISVPPPASQMSFAPLVSRVKPAVVEIATISGGATASRGETQDLPDIPGPFGDMLRRYFGQQGQGYARPQQRALGSGFIVDPTGYIVTNNHVVDGAREVSVTLTDGNKYTAKVIGRDEKTDLALVKIEAGHELPYVAFGDSENAHEGDWVLAVGNPYGLGGTVTAGIISAHGRNINEGPYDDFLQIDAPINPGNSGGPLFNQTGQVIGIDTAIYSPSGGSVGIGFAIPSNVAKTVVAQLRDHGSVTRGWLGVSMQSVTPSLAKAIGLPDDHGVLVDSVTSGSPAASAGMRQGDVITGFNGKTIKDGRDLALAVADTPAGRKVEVKLWRDNRTLTVTVTIRGQEETKSAMLSDPAAEPRVGLALAPLTPDARAELALPSSANGVLVEDVTPGSPAEDSGLQPGDVIERVSGNAVRTPVDVTNAIRSAQMQNKTAVPLLVRREGATAYVGLALQS